MQCNYLSHSWTLLRLTCTMFHSSHIYNLTETVNLMELLPKHPESQQKYECGAG